MRKYLNIHELVAVGIKNKIFDHKICYDFWADTLTGGYRDAKPLIDFIRTRPQNRFTYCELEELSTKWRKKIERVLKRQ
jgi:hypothetical protein